MARKACYFTNFSVEHEKKEMNRLITHSGFRCAQMNLDAFDKCGCLKMIGRTLYNETRVRLRLVHKCHSGPRLSHVTLSKK